MEIILQLSKEPATELALLYVEFSIEDIVQEIFDPNKGRKTKPARKGRKRRRRSFFPDHNAAIGKWIRAYANPENAFKLTSLTYVFKIWNAYELASFTAAVVEKIGDIAFDPLWGLIWIDPQHCKEFHRLIRHDDADFVVGGVGPPLQSVSVDITDFNSGFQDGNFATKCIVGEAICCFQATIEGTNASTSSRGRLVLGTSNTNVLYSSDTFEVTPGQFQSVQVSGKFPINETIAWGWQTEVGCVRMHNRNVLAYAEADIPGPLG